MKRAPIQKLILILILVSPLALVGVSLIPRPLHYEVPALGDRSEPAPYRRHPGREYIDLNGPWRFRLPGEAKWNEVAIPHTFNTLPGLEGYVGPVEYEKDIEIASIDGHWFLHFLEVRNKARVSVNAQPVGSHATGYTSFSFDIAPYLEAGRNTISGIADNTLDGDHPPNLIGWTNYGGITREAFIEHTAGCYLDDIEISPALQSSCRRLSLAPCFSCSCSGVTSSSRSSPATCSTACERANTQEGSDPGLKKR
jgi:beta-galactosidase/beta-glucuronidase